MNATIIKLIIGILLGGAWVTLAIIGKTDVAPLVAFIQYALTGLAAHTLTMVNPSKPPAEPESPPAVAPAPPAPPAPPALPALPAQSGFARPALLAIIAVVMLAGCAGLTVQWPASCLNVGLVGVAPCSAIEATSYVPPNIPASLSLQK